jgi:mono/diheme cytochrome c family protein
MGRRVDGDPPWRGEKESVSPRAVAPAIGRLLGAVLVAVAATGSVAAGDGTRGRELARHWCAGCHLVEPGGQGTDTAAPFAAMAKDPAYGPERLRAWLSEPHPPMPA